MSPKFVSPPTPTPEPVEEQEPETPTDEGALILRIEPAVQGIRVWTATELVLSTDVYGMQDKLDNSLADRVSVDKVRFDWEDTRRSGTISEATRHALRQNSTPDDREVRYTSPRIPGTYVVKANIPHSNGCRGPRGDETEEQAEARCTAEFEIVVRYKQETETEITVAKNPSGPIPGYVMDERGRQCPVFTPEEGGSLIGDGYSITAEPGAVENETYIAICMDPIGAASNVGMTHQRYTLDGDAFSVNALNTRGQRFTNYQFVTHAEGMSAASRRPANQNFGCRGYRGEHRQIAHGFEHDIDVLRRRDPGMWSGQQTACEAGNRVERRTGAEVVARFRNPNRRARNWWARTRQDLGVAPANPRRGGSHHERISNRAHTRLGIRTGAP